MENKNRILFIVESPNKCSTITQILKKLKLTNFIVMASVGHITQLKDSGFLNMGIDVNNNFKGEYVISDNKKDVVKKLKEQVKLASKIYIATDPDREGEAIAWHLKNVLGIKKYERITYQEITETAIKHALEHTRQIDDNLVSSALTRQKIDKMIGYMLSPISKKCVNAKSVGRCQSAGLKIIVDRELEIQNFKPETYYELFLNFTKNKNNFKAKYVGTNDKKIDKFKTIEECDKVAKECKGNDYIISDVKKVEKQQSPKFSFITSTYQQEVSSKLGISIEKAMQYAQKLFEGINIKGEHVALITYIRTDSTELAPEFVDNLYKYVKNKYGEKYFHTLRKTPKKENSQEGHEAIRPVDLSMTPEKLSSYVDDKDLLKIYTIIYNRTVACAMSDAIISETTYTISNKNNLFEMTSKEQLFDGYKKVYAYKEDKQEEEIVLECFNKNEKIQNCSLVREEKQTKAPKRYSQSTFIKKLDKLGIGRPSTYATILKTLLDKNRNYCVEKDKVITPTELGIMLSNWLDKYFSNIINIEYTAKLESDLDLIARGKEKDIDFLNTFYYNIDNTIKNSSLEDSCKIKCPKCGAVMKLRTGKYGKFYGCSNYPKCDGIVKYK